MDLILNSNHYTPAEIRKLNYCQLYVDMVTISDCTLPCGTLIDRAKTYGSPTPVSSRSSHLKVHQEKPSANEGRLWKRACLLLSVINGRLRKPLGKWLLPPAQQRQHPHAYTHGDMMWRRQDEENKYAEYRRFAVDEGFHDMQRSISVAELPYRATPVQIEKDADGDIWRLTTFAYRPLTSPTVTTFPAFVAKLQPWEQELLQYVEFTSEPYELCTDLQPHVRAVSDGSVRMETQGAFGWSMRNEFNNTVASGMGPARGGGGMTSYRAEAYGMLATLRFLIRMAEFTEMTFPWTGVVGTDSQSLLDTLCGKDETRLEIDRDEPIYLGGAPVVLDCACADWDILIEIQDSLKQLPMIKLQHVKGHQDRE